jgi:hypothetical protein
LPQWASMMKTDFQEINLTFPQKQLLSRKLYKFRNIFSGKENSRNQRETISIISAIFMVEAAGVEAASYPFYYNNYMWLIFV